MHAVRGAHQVVAINFVAQLCINFTSELEAIMVPPDWCTNPIVDYSLQEKSNSASVSSQKVCSQSDLWKGEREKQLCWIDCAEAFVCINVNNFLQAKAINFVHSSPSMAVDVDHRWSQNLGIFWCLTNSTEMVPLVSYCVWRNVCSLPFSKNRSIRAECHSSLVCKSNKAGGTQLIDAWFHLQAVCHLV